MTLKINRVSAILRTKYVPSFVKNPLKDVDSSYHKDVMRYKFEPVTLIFDKYYIN
jgi:hypothetical protein